MQSYPKISVVLPTYNGERFLAGAIESVIAQTEVDWELIIVNDASTDSTLEIAKRYAEADSRIRIIVNETNKKLPASLNIGFSHARGRYLTWTSDDNLYKPNAFEVMVNYLNINHMTDFVTANMDIISEDGKVLSQHHSERDILRPRDLILGCNISAAFMYRKTLADKVGDYDFNLFCAEDYDYWCRIVLAGKIDYINDNIYQYRKHRNSLTATKKRIAENNKLLIQEKYLNDFCRKFRLSSLERLKIAVINKSRIDRETLTFRLRLIYRLLKLRKALAQFTANLIFWSKPLRRKIRQKLTVSVGWAET
jgi:glycosyltransferase involved in cell wall biosynthesis